MKNTLNKHLFFRVFIFICLISSSAFLLVPLKNLWREITEAQAEKQAIKIPSLSPLVKQAQPAVLVITTEALVEREIPGFPFLIPGPPSQQQGQGSGFIINEDGYFLTNEHVIRGAQTIKVKVGLKRREYNAVIIGSDEHLDIALGRIEVLDNNGKRVKIRWPYLPLGDSDKLELGDHVVALGTPFGLTQSVLYGIVSQKNRGNIKPNGRDLFSELTQIQMPINFGSSGGPIIDLSGRVVLISESIASGNSIAFGLPINTVKNVLASLEKGGIEKSFLGIEPDELSAELADKLGILEDDLGAVIAHVHPNTPAKKAGLKAGDVVLEVDGQKISDPFKLREVTAYKGVGQILTLKIFRQEKGIMEVKVKLEKRPDQATLFKPQLEKSITLTSESMGLELADTSEYLRKELALSPEHYGARVVGIAPGSPAEAANILPNDVIVKVDKAPINSAKQLKNILDATPAGATLPVFLWRGHDYRFVHLKKPPKK